MKVALYLRRSTNDRLQHDSLRVQEQILRRYADDHGMEVCEVFRDSASGTSTRHRTAFLRMVEVITHGASFSAVLVRDVSRFGRFFDVDEGAFFEVLFLSHNVKTVYCEEVFTSDTSPMASLMKSVRRVMASEYSRDRSRLIRYAQSRATRLGFHACGRPPYGMRRVMVTAKGERVQDLAPGEWKALANHRTRLVPGDADAVATVRRIFDLFDLQHIGIARIVETLNADGTSSSRGSRWYEATVAAVLDNSAYAGLGHYTPKRKGLADPLPASHVENLAVRNAAGHEGIVSVEQFRRVERRRDESTRRRPNSTLAADARIALAKHGCVEAAMLATVPRSCSWGTYALRFERGIDEALEEAFAVEAAAHTVEIVELIEQAMCLAPCDRSWLIDESVRLRVQPVFPHRRCRGLFWRVLLPTAATDILVCYGIAATGEITKNLFLLRADQLSGRPRGLFLHLAGTGSAARFAVNAKELAARVSSLRYGVGTASETRLLTVARLKPLTNLAELARELGWPHHVVRNMYWKLVNRGEWFPALKYQQGLRLEIVCTDCGKSRWDRPNRALALRTNWCLACTTKRSRHRDTSAAS